VRIEPFTAELMPAVKDFNRRLLAGGADPELLFPEDPWPQRFVCPSGARLFEEMFLVVDEGSVRGGFVLKHQDFWLGADSSSISHYRLPVSEGAVSRRYVGVAAHMIRYATRKQPALFALGMGGRRLPLPRLLEAVQWRLWEVPLYFFVQRPARFLREIRVLRSNAGARLALQAAAVTGLGWLGARAWQSFSAHRGLGPEVTVEKVEEFSHREDEVWEDSKREYSFLAVRDSATLRTLYPANSERFLSARVLSNGKQAGWFVALDTAMREHKQFGNLRVGTIVDALARPENAAPVIRAASDFLRHRGVDLLISNQMHPAWCKALRGAGFMRGASNFVLAVSPQLQQFCGDGSGIHVNRGDGDGPIHL